MSNNNKIYSITTSLLLAIVVLFWALVLPIHTHFHLRKSTLLTHCDHTCIGFASSEQVRLTQALNLLDHHSSPCLLCILSLVLSNAIAVNQCSAEKAIFAYKFASNPISVNLLFSPTKPSARAPPIV